MDDELPRQHRPSVSQLSKTPSWVMLGFVLGALFVWALPRKEPPAPPVNSAPPEPKPVRIEAPLLTTVEALFAQWDRFAVWDNDVTQIAVWNPQVGAFAEFYEVRRIDGVYYFRSLPQLTNRPIRHGKLPPAECPILFTETEAQYREWREEGRIERPPEITRPVAPTPIRETRPAAPPPVPKIDPPAAPPLENIPGVGPAK